MQKIKPSRFKVYFLVSTDAKEYFIYNIDVYQGNNKNDIKISE